MKSSTPSFRTRTLFRIAILFIILVDAKGLRPHHYMHENYNGKGSNIGHEIHDTHAKNGMREDLGMEQYPMGSSLPDCAHACGPCRPCQRVMVSYKTSTESSPVVYKCMCRGRYYHVPSI